MGWEIRSLYLKKIKVVLKPNSPQSTNKKDKIQNIYRKMQIDRKLQNMQKNNWGKSRQYKNILKIENTKDLAVLVDTVSNWLFEP